MSSAVRRVDALTNRFWTGAIQYLMDTSAFSSPAEAQFRLGHIFRSDSLIAIREFLARNPELCFLVEGRILQIYAIIDANRVNAELRWRLGKRQNPQARSHLEESLDAGVLILIAPNFLKLEIEKYLPQIAEDTQRTLCDTEAEWQLFAAKLRFYEPCSVSLQEKVVDPKDLPYKNAGDELGLPVLTQDPHLKKMGAAVLSLCIDLACRDHARASSVTLGFTIGSSFSMTIGIEALRSAAKVIRGVFEGFRRLPPWLQAAIGAAVIVTAFHPKSRAKIMQLITSACGLALEAKGPLLDLLMLVVEQLAMAQLNANRTKNEIEAAVQHMRRAPALVYAKRICITSEGPTSIREIAHRMRIAGYISRAKNFEGYLRRVLKTSRQFIEVSSGLWEFRQSPTGNV